MVLFGGLSLPLHILPININSSHSSCEYFEVQARLAAVLGLHGTNSQISVTSIASLAANTNTNTAYRQFCKDLGRAGVTEDVIRQKEDKVLQILRSQGIVAGSENSGSNIGDQVDEVLEAAYKQFCEDLHQVGIAEASMPAKDKVLELLRSRGMASSSKIGGSSDIGDEGQVPSSRISDSSNIGDEGQLLEATC